MGKKGVIALIFIAIIVVIGVILAWIYSKKNKDLIKTKAKDTIANEAEKKEGEKEGTDAKDDGDGTSDGATNGATNGTTNGEVIDAGIPGTEKEGSTTEPEKEPIPEPVPEPPKIDEDLEFSKTILRVFNKDKYGIGANPILNNYKLTEYAENFIEKNNYN